MQLFLSSLFGSVSAAGLPWNCARSEQSRSRSSDPYDYDTEEISSKATILSGLFCPAADWCVVVSDEKTRFSPAEGRPRSDNAGRVARRDLRSGIAIRGVSRGARYRRRSLKELDLEAVASTDDKVFFIGSHANKRKSGEKNPGLASGCDRIDRRPEVEDRGAGGMGEPRQAVQGTAFLATCWTSSCSAAVSTSRAQPFWATDLLIGMRSPSRGTDGTNSAAYVISTPLAGFLDEDFSGAKLHALPTDRPFIGIRAMETVGKRRRCDHRRRGRLRPQG